MINKDKEYLDLLLDAIRVCADYQPKFGSRSRRSGYTLAQFQELYQADPFYNWFGLDSPLMYAAHKAAGGMTSVYRQIGIGCEKVFRRAVQDSLCLGDADVRWSYQVSLPGGGTKTSHLDGRIPVGKIEDEHQRQRFQAWIQCAAESLDFDQGVTASLAGAVFEVRQGYKSADAKRQSADIANAGKAISCGLLPCALILSEQVDERVVARYRNNQWTVLTGSVGTHDPTTSTYDFMRDIVGYDLEAFFRQNSSKLGKEIGKVLRTLLSARSR